MDRTNLVRKDMFEALPWSVEFFMNSRRKLGTLCQVPEKQNKWIVSCIFLSVHMQYPIY